MSQWSQAPEMVIDRLSEPSVSVSAEEIDSAIAVSSSPEAAANFGEAPLTRETREELVDDLLASRHYGEKWARHWLDIANYADTHGNDHDYARPNAWPYRDYVIRAFNEDKRYTRFVEEQIAGDELYPDDAEAIIATGFLRHFPDEYNASKWGVHDHIVFQQALQECDTAKLPFFKVILSLSSHEPFDVPMIPKFAGNDPENLFVNSCYYTDQSIGEFMVKAKASTWWDNTVIVFVADHGHRFPGNKELKDKDRYRIPLLMVGGASPDYFSEAAARLQQAVWRCLAGRPSRVTLPPLRRRSLKTACTYYQEKPGCCTQPSPTPASKSLRIRRSLRTTS